MKKQWDVPQRSGKEGVRSTDAKADQTNNRPSLKQTGDYTSEEEENMNCTDASMMTCVTSRLHALSHGEPSFTTVVTSLLWAAILKALPTSPARMSDLSVRETSSTQETLTTDERREKEKKASHLPSEWRYTGRSINTTVR